MDLADFLLARITEDENTARGSTRGPWRWFPGRGGLPAFLESTGATATHWVEGQSFEAPTVVLGSSQNSMLRVRGRDAEHIAAWHPTRVIAECRAKRQVVEAVRADDAVGDVVLRSLAAVYADHPDYSEDWRP
ncbi:DUF6221 family protein [Blastococcus sp. TF02A-26]|uniref:DUF6221 family protein n=1 Tax=Blastococcus sp. TF02A-26 TaxID=2250577 RepID=UPI0011BEFA22|nr:DUF6221 family protein [Blastococcus sp. TF02A-26]